MNQAQMGMLGQGYPKTGVDLLRDLEVRLKQVEQELESMPELSREKEMLKRMIRAAQGHL